MKVSVSVLLVAAVVVCAQAASKTPPTCPPAKTTFGICTFDPNVNCLSDSSCQGGQICCPDGCGKTCKEPEGGAQNDNNGQQTPAQGVEIMHCPKPTQFGTCVYDESINCANNNECKDGKLCCQDGCNKICSEPVPYKPVKPEPKPFFEEASN